MFRKMTETGTFNLLPEFEPAGNSRYEKIE
jgi:hypothetical protein